MKLIRYTWILVLMVMQSLNAQIQNSETLEPFIHRLKENQGVTQILFLGDSHTQADWLTGVLRHKFQERFGNTGRGLVFPYALANSNGPEDLHSYSNTTWENFRLVYEQDVFPQMGASGFVMGNHSPALIEMELAPEDSFDKVMIFNDETMDGQPLSLLETPNYLKDFIKKEKNITTHRVDASETFPELASKFYTTTTRLNQLNRSQKPQAGQLFKVEDTKIIYNPAFENDVREILKTNYSGNRTEIQLPKNTHRLLLKTHAKNGNIFYGFQFLKNSKRGVVFNTVGVNGATYADYLKHPLQIEQLQTLNPDIVIIALGTNESLSTIKEEEFKSNAKQLIKNIKSKNPHLPILILSPQDNQRKSERVAQISAWLETVAKEEHTAFFDLHQALGGRGYFNQALKRNEANRDGVHFLKSGYEKQADKIFNAIETLLQK